MLNKMDFPFRGESVLPKTKPAHLRIIPWPGAFIDDEVQTVTISLGKKQHKDNCVPGRDFFENDDDCSFEMT